MKTLPKQTLVNGEDGLTSLQEGFLASLSPSQVKERERMITVTSGHTCSVLYGKSAPLGLLVKTLLESSRWFSPARRLKWEARPLFSEKITEKRVLLRQEFVVETICKDLEREGYSVQPILIPACAVGAPHRRDRVWFVARLTTDAACYGSGGTPHESCRENERQDRYETQQSFFRGCVRTSSHSQFPRSRQIHEEVQPEEPDGDCVDCNGNEWNASNSNPKRFPTFGFTSSVNKEEWENENRCPMQSSCNVERASRTDWWKEFPTQSPVCRGNDGLPFDVDNLTIPFTKWRQESVKGYGNAIVPQVILEIFKAIEEVEQLE